MSRYSITVFPLAKLLCFFILLTGCKDDNSEMDPEPANEFEIDFPSNWDIETELQPPFLIAGFSPLDGLADNFKESVSVGKEESPNLDLDQYVEAGKNELLNFNEFNLLTEERIEVNSREAQSLTYTASINGITIKNIVHIYYENEAGYVVTGGATEESFESFRLIFEEILRSFVIN